VPIADAWLIWWSMLCVAALINVAAWGVSAWLLGRRGAHSPADVRSTRRRLLWLSAIYVAGCGFRSVFPMVDVPRICLHDTWISRIVVGRLVATGAELALAAQLALLLREAGTAAGGGLATSIARVLVPLIVVAEIFSWLAVLTTSYLLHAGENSLWTLAAVLVVAGLASVWPRVDEKSRRFVAAAMAGGSSYVIFMVFVDVPMYLSRWRADLVAGRGYLSLREGMAEVLDRCIVMREWAAWQQDVAWLSLYFTVAVWASIALAHVPPLRGADAGPQEYATAPPRHSWRKEEHRP
jgi:hypothetical protein